MARPFTASSSERRPRRSRSHRTLVCPSRSTWLGVIRSAQLTTTRSLTARAAVRLAAALFGLSLASGIAIAVARGWLVIPLGAGGALLAWQYGWGPVKYGYRGFGDLGILATFGVLAVVGSFYVQTKQFDSAALWASVVPGLFMTVVLFNHKSHEARINPDANAPYKAKAGAACIGCHHTANSRGIPQLWKCSSCHRGEGAPTNPKNRDFDEVWSERAFHDSCIGCHRASLKGPTTCGECHKPGS